MQVETSSELAREASVVLKGDDVVDADEPEMLLCTAQLSLSDAPSYAVESSIEIADEVAALENSPVIVLELLLVFAAEMESRCVDCCTVTESDSLSNAEILLCCKFLSLSWLLLSSARMLKFCFDCFSSLRRFLCPADRFG